MKIGILGGTFNPPHIGHFILAQGAFEQLNLDRVFFVPTNDPPHKNNNCLDPCLRLEMARLAFEDNPGFEVLDIEIKRKGVSYTVDTLIALKQKYRQADFYLIVGADLANNFNQWRESGKIKDMVKVVVAKRTNLPLTVKNGFLGIDIVQVEISSSIVRQRIRDSKSIKYLVPERVEKYIKDNNLYRD